MWMVFNVSPDWVLLALPASLMALTLLFRMVTIR
jgi:hypothetical protein